MVGGIRLRLCHQVHNDFFKAVTLIPRLWFWATKKIGVSPSFVLVYNQTSWVRHTQNAAQRPMGHMHVRLKTLFGWSGFTLHFVTRYSMASRRPLIVFDGKESRRESRRSAWMVTGYHHWTIECSSKTRTNNVPFTTCATQNLIWSSGIRLILFCDQITKKPECYRSWSFTILPKTVKTTCTNIIYGHGYFHWSECTCTSMVSFMLR